MAIRTVASSRGPLSNPGSPSGQSAVAATKIPASRSFFSLLTLRPANAHFSRRSGAELLGSQVRLAILAGLSFLALVVSCPAEQLKPEQIYQKLLPSVMTLEVVNTEGEKFVGSAFLALEDGVAVTAWHVIHDARSVVAKFANEDRYEITGFIDKDEKRDLALFRIECRGQRPLVSICDAAPMVGSRAYVLGAPKGFEFSFTDGMISQIQRVDGFQQYQVSCPISAGNSGGPVVNDSGQVMGVTSWTKMDAQNLNFAIPGNYVRSLDPSKPITPWASSSRRRSNRSGAAPREPDAAQTGGPNKGLPDLRAMLNGAVGKRVTIVVLQEGEEQKFNFTVPQDLLK